MLKTPSQTVLLYDELLVKTSVPERSRFLYKKWLRYYLDFCHKYRCEPSKRENLSGFLNKLKDKKQNKDQQKQAAHAISIFCEIRWPNSDRKDNNKARTINKRLPPPNTIGKSLTNADWTSVYNDLDAEIKIRHYSPKTLKAYRGWVRQFQFRQSDLNCP